MMPRNRATSPVEASDRIEVHIPLRPPSVNTYVRHYGGNRHVVSKEAEAFKSAVIILSRGKRVEGRVRVEIHCYFPNRRAPDSDNCVKLCLDGLQAGGVIENDNLVDELLVKRYFGSQSDSTSIVVQKIIKGSLRHNAI